jgi:hypothetical protein
MEPIDWANPHNSEVLSEVVRKNPAMKPRNQRKIASRILRGLPVIKRNRSSNRKPLEIGQIPDTAEYWTDIKRAHRI